MASSISHSKPAVPGLALGLIGVALVAWLLSAFYTLRVNPEVAFLRHADTVKQTWARSLEREHQTKIVICGGSSCATSIDGERMLQTHELPVLNLGLNAGMGAKVLTRYALQSLRPGDTFILAMEPGLLTTPLELETLGIQFSLATGHQSMLRDPDRIHWPKVLLNLRLGGFHVFTLLGKLLLRQPLYRYSPDEFHASGWQEVVVKREFSDLPTNIPPLSEDARQLLAFIRDDCARRGVRVAYSLPWRYCPPEMLAASHRYNAIFLHQISEFLPVLKEPGLGSHTVREHFADTAWHPTAAGAALRTDELAGQIKSWETWPRADLLQAGTGQSR